MDYTNPDINIIILSPGRTGSMLIWDILTKVTRKVPIRRDHTHNILPMNPRECLHSHDPHDVYLGNKHTWYIVSKRNVIESALSSTIVEYTGKFQYHKYEKYDIKPFVLDIKDFYRFYYSKHNFYEKLKPILPTNSLIIDYSDFENDLSNLLSKLNLPSSTLQFYSKNLIKQKTPGTHRDYIINYNEISEIAKNLNPNPCI